MGWGGLQRRLRQRQGRRKNFFAEKGRKREEAVGGRSGEKGEMGWQAGKE